MTKRLIIASVASAIALFFWGGLYWAQIAVMISPWKTVDTAENNSQAIESLKQIFPESGVYMYPWVGAAAKDQPGSEEEFNKQHADGPIVQVFYHAEGIPPEAMGKMMGFGFLHMLVSSFLCCYLLKHSNCGTTFLNRLCFVFTLGLFTTIWIEGADLIWWHYPLSHVLFMGTYNVMAWLIAGAVIAAIMKPESEFSPS